MAMVGIIARQIGLFMFYNDIYYSFNDKKRPEREILIDLAAVQPVSVI
jgi:hypothetical protein